MESVERFLRQSVRTDRTGARVIARDEHTLILYDAPEWGDGQSTRLRGRFPECEVTVTANSNSLSGFVVVIRRHSHPRAHVWASLLVLALMAVGYAVARLHRLLGPG